MDESTTDSTFATRLAARLETALRVPCHAWLFEADGWRCVHVTAPLDLAQVARDNRAGLPGWQDEYASSREPQIVRTDDGHLGVLVGTERLLVVCGRPCEDLLSPLIKSTVEAVQEGRDSDSLMLEVGRLYERDHYWRVLLGLLSQQEGRGKSAVLEILRDAARAEQIAMILRENDEIVIHGHALLDRPQLTRFVDRFGALAEADPVVFNNMETFPDFAEYRGLGSAIVAPIAAVGRSLGWITAFAPPRPESEEFGTDEAGILASAGIVLCLHAALVPVPV